MERNALRSLRTLDKNDNTDFVVGGDTQKPFDCSLVAFRPLHCQLRRPSHGSNWEKPLYKLYKEFVFPILNIYTSISSMTKRKNIFDPWVKFT